jgi:hypothetical protein
MEAIEQDVEIHRSVNDTNEALRVRLSGQALHALRPVAGELQRLVVQRSNAKLADR